jgi:hypothetical protein
VDIRCLLAEPLPKSRLEMRTTSFGRQDTFVKTDS